LYAPAYSSMVFVNLKFSVRYLYGTFYRVTPRIPGDDLTKISHLVVGYIR